MAAEKDLELDDEAAEESGGKSKKMLIIIIAAVVLILAIAGGAAFFLLSGDDSEAQGVDQQASKAVEEIEQKPKVASYVTLDPAFVVSFQAGTRVRFLQIKLELMTYDDDVVKALEDNMPMIRNEIVMIVGSQEFAGLRTEKGRTDLQKLLLDRLNSALKEDAEIDGIEAVLFTDYVMQ